MMSMVFKCDQCARVIGRKKHISLPIAGSDKAGIALPPETETDDFDFIQSAVDKKRPYWDVATKGIKGQFLHFCNSQCIGRYFGKKLKEATPEPTF